MRRSSYGLESAAPKAICPAAPVAVAAVSSMAPVRRCQEDRAGFIGRILSRVFASSQHVAAPAFCRRWRPQDDHANAETL
jgi:hypothetical protein